MRRTCDGFDPDLIMHLDIHGRPTADLEFAVIAETCCCGSIFDDRYHETFWPHDYVGSRVPVRKIVDLTNTGEYL